MVENIVYGKKWQKWFRDTWVNQTWKNLLIAGLQNNLAFHDVNPVNSVEGSRNAFI